MTNIDITLKEKENIYYIEKCDNNRYTFTIPKLTSSTLYLYIENNSNDLTINLLDDSNLNLVLITLNNKNINHVFNLSSNSSLNMYLADINKDDSTINKTVNLNGLNASIKSYEFSSLNNITDKETFIINHNFKSTTSSIAFQLLTKGKSVKDLKALANIEIGMTDCNSSELIKGMMLSNESKINAKPVLVVKHDDVKANHGCAIGTIDQNEIYYLMSRGLTYKDALVIISRSFINPILKEIKNNEFKSRVAPLLEELINE